MKTKDIVFISLFTALTVAGAFLRLPLPFLSVTFQLLFAILAGIILGPVRGMIAMALYMLLGLLGIPIFSMGGGIGYIAQPSFGFILGFIPGAFAAGTAYKKLPQNSFLKSLLSFLIGTIVVYIIGIPYMFLIMKFFTDNPGLTFWITLLTMLPYIAKDIILGILVSFLSRYLTYLNTISK